MAPERSLLQPSPPTPCKSLSRGGLPLGSGGWSGVSSLPGSGQTGALGSSVSGSLCSIAEVERGVRPAPSTPGCILCWAGVLRGQPWPQGLAAGSSRRHRRGTQSWASRPMFVSPISGLSSGAQRGLLGGLWGTVGFSWAGEGGALEWDQCPAKERKGRQLPGLPQTPHPRRTRPGRQPSPGLRPPALDLGLPSL